MRNHKMAINLIKDLTGQANILTIPRAFVDYTGSLDIALFLSQVLYWSDRSDDPTGWFFKTYAEWQSEICLSEYQIRKSAKKLVKFGILETKIKKAFGSPTVHYRLDFDKFSVSFPKFLQERNLKNFRNDPLKTEGSLTETTTETTTETQGPGENFDYLDNVKAHEPGKETTIEPSDFERHFGGYRDKTLNTYNQEFGITLNQGRKDALIELSRAEKFDIDVFKDYTHQYNVNGGYSYDLEKFCSGYWRFCDGDKIKDAMYPDRKLSKTFDKTPNWEKTGKLVIS